MGPTGEAAESASPKLLGSLYHILEAVHCLEITFCAVVKPNTERQIFDYLSVSISQRV
jgi:hypothetical protein